MIKGDKVLVKEPYGADVLSYVGEIVDFADDCATIFIKIESEFIPFLALMFSSVQQDPERWAVRSEWCSLYEG